MAELKTKPTSQSVDAFLETIADAEKQADCKELAGMMREATQAEPQMWGNIVGFGRYHYKYASGREGDWFVTGFAPRKQALTLYIMSGFAEYETLMAKLGNYKTGVSCLYIKKLADVDTAVLRQLITQSVQATSNEQ